MSVERRTPPEPVITPELPDPPADEASAGAEDPPGGYVAHFRYSDGTRLEIAIAHAVSGGGCTDHQISRNWWRLRKGDEVLNEGPLKEVLRKGSHEG